MSGLFGGNDIPPPPPPKPTPPMPDLESPAVLEAQRVRTAAIVSRSGRSSTLLSQDDSGRPYTRKTLGG